MNKKVIISFVLSAMLCAPYAQAMHLLQKAQQSGAIAMRPIVRSVLAQGQTIAHTAVPQAQRGLMTLAPSTVRPANQWLLSGPNLTRQLSTTTRQQAATSIKSLAIKAGVIGLAYAASPSTAACSDGSYLSLFANGFASLVGVLGLYEIITVYPDVTPELLVSKNALDIYLVDRMIRENPDYAQQFAELVTADNIINVNTHILSSIIRCYPKVAKDFTLYLLPHIKSLVKDYWGISLLEIVMQENPKAAKDFIPYLVPHIESLVKDYWGIGLLKTVIWKNPEAAKTFTPYLAPHIESLVKGDYWMEKNLTYSNWEKNNWSLAFLNNVMQANPASAKDFTPYLIPHIESLVKGHCGLSILENVMKQNPEGVASFIESALVAQSENPTPTELYVMQHKDKVNEKFGGNVLLLRSATMKAVKKVIALERRYEPTHYTFTHGRNRAYDCVSTVYGILWKYAYNTEVPEDFIFTHTKDAHDPLMHKVKLNEERKLHEANIKERANIEGEVRNRRLFLNTQLFGNMKVGGSSSFSYFLRSDNASGKVKVAVKDVFAQFGQQALYETYKEEFEALEREHKALSEQGELLVVAVPKERVNQDVTCMDVNGSAAPLFMINGKKTNNVQEILEARKKDPSIGDNKLNFTLAMTDTAALDPNSGIKIHSVQEIDQERYAAWKAKVDALMVKIEAEFKASWQQSLNAKERGHGNFLDAVRTSQKYMSAKNQQK